MAIAKQIKLPSLLLKAETQRDFSVKIITSTREVSDEDLATLFSMRKNEMWQVLVAYDDAPDTLELPTEAPVITGYKSPSAQLRSILFVYWEKLGGENRCDSFNEFYDGYIQNLISAIKQKLT